jgi:hypothetical protein
MMATRFTDAQVASYIQNNALSGPALQQAAQVFQLQPDQIARAQQLLAGNDPSIQAASQAYEAAVAGRPDLVAENLSFYDASTGTGSGLANVQQPVQQQPVTQPVVQPVQQPKMPANYDQAYVNQLLKEAAFQAGGDKGTLSYADVTNAARNLGIPTNMINTAMGGGTITESVMPFANATQGFQDNFNNYTSIPIGGQYNPSMVGGTGSPYSQIMSQMRPVGNPYAGVLANQPIGGYNPNIYNPNLLSDFMNQRAAALSAAGMPVTFDAGAGGGDAGISDGGNGIGGNSTAGGMSNQGEGGPDGVGGWAKGGLIDRVAGKNPAGPDDGQINAQVGEYVVKKSSVNKYGKSLLDMINDGKIPAKKMKSLLG